MCNIKTISADIYWISGKFVGINYVLLPNREWNKKQKHKKQPWINMECFAFGGATVCFASLETSFHAANHKPKGRFFYVVNQGILVI